MRLLRDITLSVLITLGWVGSLAALCAVWLLIIETLIASGAYGAYSCNDLLIGTAQGGGGAAGCDTYATCSDTNCPCDLTAEFAAVWTFQNVLTVSDDSICGVDGTDCDLTKSVGSGTDTDGFFQDSDCTGSGTPLACCTGSGTGNCILSGTYAAYFDDEADYMNCGSACATASYLNPLASDSWTHFCVVYPITDSGSASKQFLDASNNSSQNFYLSRNRTPDDCRASMRVSGSFSTIDGTNNACSVDGWIFVGQVFEYQGSGTDQIQTLIVDAADDNADTSKSYTRNATSTYYIGSSQGKTQQGLYQLCALVQTPLSSDALCQMCACGPANEFDCLCDDTDATAYQDMNGGTAGLGANGRNASCGNCLDSIGTACDIATLDAR